MILEHPPRVSLVCVGQEGEHNELAQAFLNDAVSMLARTGLELAGRPPQVLLDHAGVAAAAQAGCRAGADCVLFLIGTWILADKVIDAVRSLPLPAAVWGVPEGTSFSSVGANVVHGALDELGLEHTLFYGMPDDEALQAGLAAYARACRAVRALKRARLGLLGGRSISAYPTAADPNQIKALFGAEVVHIDQLALLEGARALPADRVAAELDAFCLRHGPTEAPREVLDKSLRVYLALKDIRQRYDLDFLAVKCLEEFIDAYTSCCAAVSLLNDEGIVTACQSDLNAALSMFLLHALSGQPAIFGDVNTVDCASGVVRMINCGSMAAALAGREPVRWMEQYAYMGAGRGVCPVFCCKEGPVTFGTLGRVRGEYVLLIAGGRAYEEPFDAYRSVRDWPQSFITLEADPRQFYQNLRSNHSVAGYGDLRRELRFTAELLHIRALEL